MGRIINIKSKREFKIVEKTKFTCKHRAILIDKDQRTVECENCGDLIDPIWVLLEWLREGQRFKSETFAYQRLLKELFLRGSVKANNEYICDLCERIIKKGNRYYRKQYTKACVDCVKNGREQKDI